MTDSKLTQTTTFDKRLQALQTAPQSKNDEKYEENQTALLTKLLFQRAFKRSTWTQLALLLVHYTFVALRIAARFVLARYNMASAREDTFKLHTVLEDEVYLLESVFRTSVVLKAQDGTLLLFQPPRLNKKAVALLNTVGRLAVIFVPELLHDQNASEWKQMFPQVQMVVNKEYYDLWFGRFGDDSSIDGVFDKSKTNDVTPVKPGKRLQKYGFAEHVSAKQLVDGFSDYAHVLQTPKTSRRVVIAPSGFANFEYSILNQLTGLAGPQVLYHAPFTYLSGLNEIQLFWRRLTAVKPEIVLFKHGVALDGAKMTAVHCSKHWFGLQALAQK